MKNNKKTIYKQLKETFDSLDSERSVVGGLLIDPCLDRVLGTGLVYDDFSYDFFTGISLGFSTVYKDYTLNIAVKNLGSIGIINAINISKLIN